MRSPDDADTLAFAKMLVQSYQHWVGKELTDSEDLVNCLYHASFAVVAHGVQADPIFCYANLTAQTLFEYTWDEFMHIPSRLSAPPTEQAERTKLFERAERDGYVDDYAGIRISKSGRRFYISDTILWKVVDGSGRLCGHAAAINNWRFFEP